MEIPVTFNIFFTCKQVVVDLLFNVLPTVCGSSVFCDLPEEEEEAGCFAIIVIRCIVTINVLWLYLTVPWVSLQYVNVVFPDYTYFAESDEMPLFY